MTWREAEAIGWVRQADDDPRAIVGLAIPYGAVSNVTDILPGTGEFARETIYPGAFRSSVDHWMTRQDGARLPFRPRHKERPVGAVTSLTDTPDGVMFRASIFETPRGNEYLAEVHGGLNGVSAEIGPGSVPSKRGRDGIVVQRDGKLMGIAGSDQPAYDGARIALRDMEEPEVPNETPAPTPPTPPPPDEPAPTPTLGERDAAERAAVAAIIPRSSILITRPEAVYGPRSEFNWLGDNYRANVRKDSDAFERQERHGKHLYDVALSMEREAAARMMGPVISERAGDLLSTEIPGAYPNDYLPGLLTPRILKGRPMGDFYTRFPIADARPRIFAKVTTSSAVAVQSAEGAALAVTDMATTAVTANPLMYGATIDVSRQVLDGADPSALAMLYQDLLESYSQASETVIKTAVEAGSTASGVAITAATPYAGVIANVVNYYATRFKACTGAFIPSAEFSVLAAQNDTTGRPLLPAIGSTNSDGAINAGETLTFQFLTAQGFLSYASTVNVNVFGRPSDFVIYESPIVTVQYDQVVGPQAVRIGLWAYLVVAARLGSLKVTAA